MAEMSYNEKMKTASQILASGIQLNETIDSFNSMELEAKTLLTDGLLGDASKKDMNLLLLYGQCSALIEALRSTTKCIKELNDTMAEAIKDNEGDENGF